MGVDEMKDVAKFFSRALLTKEDPKIIFERNEGLYNQESDIDTKALSTKVRYNSVQGNLLIFRSSLHHCVEMKQDDSERISLAYNFNLKKQ